MGVKEYHYKMQIPLIGVFGFLFFILFGLLGLRSYWNDNIQVEPDPRFRYEFAANSLAEYFPFGFVILSLFFLFFAFWMLLLCYRSTLSLLGIDRLPLVFSSKGLTKSSILGNKIEISWGQIKNIKLLKTQAHVYSKDGQKRISINYHQIEGLDSSQLKKDILRYLPGAQFSENYSSPYS